MQKPHVTVFPATHVHAAAIYEVDFFILKRLRIASPAFQPPPSRFFAAPHLSARSADVLHGAAPIFLAKLPPLSRRRRFSFRLLFRFVALPPSLFRPPALSPLSFISPQLALWKERAEEPCRK